jgi:hypothetical protein
MDVLSRAGYGVGRGTYLDASIDLNVLSPRA